MTAGGAPNILAVQLRRLGDLVLATPAFRAIRAHHPGARITVLTEPPFHEILEGLECVDAILLHPRGALRSAAFGLRLGRGGWDLAIDFHGNPTSARLTAQSGAPERVGFALRGRRLAYTRAVPLATDPPRYTADMKLDLVRAAGIPAVDAAPRLRALPADLAAGRDLLLRSGADPGRPFLAVAPASRRAYKRWDAEKFADVLRSFRDATGAASVLIGGPGEEQMIAAVAGAMVPSPPVIRPGSIRALVGSLAQAAAFAGPDGGAKQIAQALGLPSLALFGPQNPVIWTNRDLPHAVIAGRAPDCTRRCSALDVPCRCLAAVPPAEVARALVRLWAGSVAAPCA